MNVFAPAFSIANAAHGGRWESKRILDQSQCDIGLEVFPISQVPHELLDRSGGSDLDRFFL